MHNQIAAAIAAAFIGTAANAAVLQYDISFATSGSPNPAELSFTLDTEALVSGGDQTVGLGSFTANFAVDDGVVAYHLFSSGSNISVGGLANNVSGVVGGTSDFLLQIFDFASFGNAFSFYVFLVQSNQEGFIASGVPSSFTVSVTDVTPGAEVPLPAGLPLLLAGLGMLGLARRRR